VIGHLSCRGGSDPYKAAQNVGFAWLIIWTWLGKRFGLFGMRQKQIYETFKKERALPLPFDKTIFRGALMAFNQKPTIETIDSDAVHRPPWNKGKIVGQKAP
jgi:hypothetical protein